tara:strand:- start:484 stop:1200 length:717 start_codon:yes stop_codon:yes gene_type:complete
MKAFKKSFLIIIIFTTSSVSQEIMDFEGSLYPKYSKYLENISNDLKNYFVFNFKTDKKQLVITFDDGPNLNTKKIIAYLAKNNIPATFFLITSQLNDTSIEYYNNALFEIGIHSYSHKNFDKISKLEIENDLKKSVKYHNIKNITTQYFRTPYGIINKDLKETLKKLNLSGIMWSIDSHDWNSKNSDYIFKKSTQSLKKGSIILFHDSLKIDLLKRIIKEIYNEGYEIISLSKALKNN